MILLFLRILNLSEIDMTFHEINEHLRILVEGDSVFLFFKKISIEIDEKLPLDILSSYNSIALNEYFDELTDFEKIYKSLIRWVYRD